MKRVARLGTSLGPVVALWLVVPVVLARAAPDAPVWLLGLIGVAGVAAHLGGRLLSNRGWFVGDRSPVELVGAALAVATVVGAALLVVALVGHRVADGDGEIDRTLVVAAAGLMTGLVVTAFWGRVEFRGWLLYHREVRHRVRPLATAPIGPDRAVAHDLIDDLVSADSIDRADVDRVAARLRLASDDRFRRTIPWSSARPLLTSFVETLGRTASVDHSFATEDTHGDVPVVLGPLCDLSWELAADPSVRDLRVAAAPGATGGIELTIGVSLDPDRRRDPVVASATVRSLDALGPTIVRPDPDSVVVGVAFGPGGARTDDGGVEAFLDAPIELLAESPYSAGARRVYRRGDNVLKVQRHDVSDPKPTLLEDEFHLLRRLQGRSARFATATGYGIERSFSWIAYTFVDGRPLDAVIETDPVTARSRLLAYGVDIDDMLEHLAACRVAHRDLNPGNMIEAPDGSLVLIDFDQAASGAELVGADLLGVDDGRAKNDLGEFLERAGLTRVANELLVALDDAWSDDIAFSLGVLGHRYGAGWRLDPLLDAARARLHPVAGRRVLDLGSASPVAGMLLASAGAEVTAVVDDPSRWERAARLVGPRLHLVRDAADAVGPVELTLDLDGRAPELEGAVLRRHTGRPDAPAPADPWFVTTDLAVVGR